MEGVGDTFDVVPIGAWWGKGKRKGEQGQAGRQRGQRGCLLVVVGWGWWLVGGWRC